MSRPSPSSAGPPSPTLYRLASDRRYDRIPPHVESNPQDVVWEDHYGSTALHVLCRSENIGEESLLHAVDAILKEAPFLAGRPNCQTWTPLHLACEKRLLWRTSISTDEMVLKLIAACPAAVSRKLETGFKAKTPFHISCEVNASIDVLRAMLRINPRLATQPYIEKDTMYATVDTPLQLLWSAIRKERVTTTDQHHLSKMALLLQAAFYGTVDEDDLEIDFSIVTAACSIPCPREYMEQVLSSTHSQQVSQLDQKGYLPLHFAIMAAQEDSPSYTNYLMERLLEEYPEAASTPFGQSSSVLPLHVLIADRRMTWHKGGVQHLALASANVLRIPDPRSRLVPFLASAEHATTNSRLHLSTTYELLRAAPEVIRGGFFTNSATTSGE
jgi:ankyrin repeat protein